MSGPTPFYNPTLAGKISKDAVRAARKFIMVANLLYSPGNATMEKYHYQHFVRLYNRRKQQTFKILDSAGYQRVTVKRSVDYRDAKAWCKQNLKHGAWVNNLYRFYFAYDDDAVLFKLMFSRGL